MSTSRVDELINYFKSHNKIREQQSHSAKVHSVGWSCDGKLLASGSFDKSVCIFSLCPDRLVSKHNLFSIILYDFNFSKFNFDKYLFIILYIIYIILYIYIKYHNFYHNLIIIKS